MVNSATFKVFEKRYNFFFVDCTQVDCNQVDIQRKLQQDPLIALRKTQVDTRKRILEVVMKPAANAGCVKPGLGAIEAEIQKKERYSKRKSFGKRLKALGKTEDDYAKEKEAKGKDFRRFDQSGVSYRHTFEMRLVKAQTSDANFNESYLDSYNSCTRNISNGHS